MRMVAASVPLLQPPLAFCELTGRRPRGPRLAPGPPTHRQPQVAQHMAVATRMPKGKAQAARRPEAPALALRGVARQRHGPRRRMVRRQWARALHALRHRGPRERLRELRSLLQAPLKVGERLALSQKRSDHRTDRPFDPPKPLRKHAAPAKKQLQHRIRASESLRLEPGPPTSRGSRSRGANPRPARSLESSSAEARRSRPRGYSPRRARGPPRPSSP